MADAGDLAVAHASGDTEGLARHEGAEWVAIDTAKRVRGTNTNPRLSNDNAPVVLPDPLLQKINPSKLISGIHGPRYGVPITEARIDGVSKTFVVTHVWTNAKGQIVGSEGPLTPMDSNGVMSAAVVESAVTYFVVVSTAGAEAATRAVNPILLLALPAAMALIAGVAWYSVGRALKPVKAISGELAAITSASLERRVPVPETRDEIAELAATTNATLDRLEDAVTRQRRFIADAAHELRSPLAALRNTLEVAQSTAGPADPDVVLSLTLRLQNLTDDLLLLARLDGAETLHPAAVDLGVIVEEQVAERQFGNTTGIDFTATISGPTVVTGDRLQLERLVRNLLDNATRHASNTVTATVSVGDSTVTIEVVDDGEGIAPEDHERIFQPFTRLDDARARDSGGTGLGLAIVRTITSAHHGQIRVDNAPGARFTVQLPR